MYFIYLGGKDNYPEEFFNIFHALRGDRVYVEPFLGFGAVAKCMSNPRILSDVNKSLVELIRALRDDIDLPIEVTKDEYLRLAKTSPSAVKGWVGFVFSSQSRFFNGFFPPKSSVVENYLLRYQREMKALLGAELLSTSYKKLEIPNNSLVYCDPPYVGTVEYKQTPKFDFFNFWHEWVPDQASKNLVLVSEFFAPMGFYAIWRMMKKSLKGLRYDNLFVHESQYEQVCGILRNVGIQPCADPLFCTQR